MKPKRSNKQTLTGILIPEKWDDKGNVVGLSLQTFDESEYIVRAYRLREELLKFINQEVEITGKVVERLDGKIIIEANRFAATNNFKGV